MPVKMPHSRKSTESSSFEIIYSILDSIDIINELNSKIDRGQGNIKDNFKNIFRELNYMVIELKALVLYWSIIRFKVLREKYKSKKREINNKDEQRV